jgi:hypothetical protein
LKRDKSHQLPREVLVEDFLRGQGSTAFTYQGQLHDSGTNANGAYTMIFGP